MGKVLVLIGGSSVGKDFLQNKISKKYNIPICVSSTTRPPRKEEINHITYHFISDKQFKDDLNNDKFIEHRTYNTKYGQWLYGLSKDSIDLEKNQLVILDQNGYYTLAKAIGKDNVLGIYVYVPERLRIHRALMREQNKNDKDFFRELYRRFSDDLYAFEKIEQDDNVYKIENIDTDESMKQIKEILMKNKII